MAEHQLKMASIIGRRESSLKRVAKTVPCPIRLFFAFLLCCAPLPALAASSYPAAHKAMVDGHADTAISLLQPILAANPRDAEAHYLLCRVYSMERRDDEAIKECLAAVASSPDTGEYYRWLARAYGAKAEHSSAFTALGLVKRVRENFTKAVKLDPSSIDALTDLGEFYLEAPSALGGGAGKAQALVPHLSGLDAAAGHWLQARIAEDRGDAATAEPQYKLAIASASSTAMSTGPASNKAQAWADLAAFYRRQNRKDDAVNAVRQALASDPLHDGALVSAAGTLNAMKLEPQMAATMLRDYLSSPHKTAEEPAFEVYVTLGKLLSQQGDAAGASKAYSAALAMAHDYAPAKKAAKLQ